VTTIHLWAGAAVLATAAFAQTAPPKPTFDVASVKVSDASPRRDAMGPFGGRGNIKVEPASLTMRNVTLKNAIRWAYGVTEYQVSGPEWLDALGFNIVAKSAAAAPEDQLRQMMQSLLAERFKLEFHRLTKEFSVYVLAPGKNGSKLTESKTEGDTNVQPVQNSMVVSVQRMPISQIIEILTPVMGAPVIDKTGLKGKYDATINMGKYIAELQTTTAAGSMPDPVSLIMLALEGEAGLKLERQKIPLEVLVVDHAEKTPTEN